MAPSNELSQEDLRQGDEELVKIMEDEKKTEPKKESLRPVTEIRPEEPKKEHVINGSPKIEKRHEISRVHQREYIPNPTYPPLRQEIEKNIFDLQTPIWQRYHNDKNLAWEDIKRELDQVEIEQSRYFWNEHKKKTDAEIKIRFRDPYFGKESGMTSADWEEIGKQKKAFMDEKNREYNEVMGSRSLLSDEEKIERLQKDLGTENGSGAQKAEKEEGKKKEKPVDEKVDFDYAKYVAEEKRNLETQREEYFKEYYKYLRNNKGREKGTLLK